MQVNKALLVIESRLSEKRYQHSVQVADTAQIMAEKFDLNSQKAYLTGLLHDYARDMPFSELIEIAEKNQLMLHPLEKAVPELLHGPVGAFLLLRDMGVQDEEILNAVKHHTLGAVQMSDFEKVIYLADMIEPGRKYPGVEELRKLAYKNLDQAMLFGLENTIKYCLEKKKILHPQTVEVRNWFLQLVG